MKAFHQVLILILLSLFALACNLYESDAHKFLNDNGTFQNGKVVLNSTLHYDQATCYSPAQEHHEQDSQNFEQVINHQTNGQTTITLYINPENSQIKSVISDSQQDISCFFSLKSPQVDNKTIDSILAKSIELFSTAE